MIIPVPGRRHDMRGVAPYGKAKNDLQGEPVILMLHFSKKVFLFTFTVSFLCPSKSMRLQSAFTLLELLIVMTLIVMIMALAAPWVQRVRARSELRSIAQNLQGELYATRLAAMKSGEAYLFRYQSQTGVYEILPKKVYDALNPKPQTTASVDSQYATRSVGTPVNQSRQSININNINERTNGEQVSTLVYRKSLPNRLTFGTVKTVSNRNSQEALDPDSIRSVGSPINSSLISSASLSEPEPPVWSEPILFFPNGRTSNGSLELLTLGTYRFQIELTLRGLTGTARLGEITNAEP